MSLIKLPELKINALSNVSFDMRTDAIERWQPEISASSDSSDNTITMYEAIGEDFWSGGGVTAKRIGAALRSIGERDVVVNINSPGGDFFEGVAIYNLLRQHPAKVTVNVMGLAASAASVIAMAGDEILMGDGAFLMIHNAWAVSVGNRHDMRQSADTLEPFDDAMAELYAKRGDISKADAAALMDKESWLHATAAIEHGLATGEMQGEITHDTQANHQTKYLATVEAALAKQGHTRSQRRELFNNLFNGTPCATEPTTPCAGDTQLMAGLNQLIDTIKS